MPLFDSLFSKSPPPTSSIGAVGASVGAAVGAATQRVKLPGFGRHLLRGMQAHQFYIIVGAASISSLLLLRSVAGSSHSRTLKPIPSPREVLPPEVLRASPYPPDALDGARDVETPYGSIRVYEWGPKDGKRVLLIHGMSTPSVALSDLAHKLVKKGCRVMVFDLFGRGYSSAPDPRVYRYDSALYIAQISMALQSSPIGWSSFAIVGYSLGGAIAADFASYFPNLVRGLVLVAPGGLIRTNHIGWLSKFIYSPGGILPEFFVNRLVSSKLHKNPELASTIEPDAQAVETGVRFNGVSLSESHGSVAEVLDWQLQYHKGFIPAFISTMRYAPLHNQHDRWGVIRENIERKQGRLKEVWFVLGEMDPVVVAEELMEDAKNVLGEELARFRLVKGVGHEVATERADEIVRVVSRVL
ncbi:alpha/beta-hydrolase [Cucurbitaria berberidis CBS 394.84]|uniref:Alpha/beta-hydrolase n=1 Tax=Cucurbitaria berberidis CBS 394.84 TaxID=1168544 RepID=A0A9P4L973_9PLEO|nr:alpha/beta-hydrolase [Cucurbitaria berberidis CBS 394.84]KAF1846861.1 alpha/beta-hydrolase [Cucurbitaria berberidis CBS 394.84]